MRNPTYRHRVEYLAFRSVTWVTTVLPERVAVLLADLLGVAVGVVLRIRRRQVRENLAVAFPDQTPRWRARIARRAYRHLARESVATLRFSRTHDVDLRTRVDAPSLGKVREALEEGRGTIIVTGHLGNWEMGGAAMAAFGLPLDVVAQRQMNPLFDRDLNATRARLGLRVFRSSHAVRPLLRALREGRAIAFVADQNVRRGGVFVDFFGVLASTARGPAVLALRTGAPVFAAALTRKSGGRGYELGFERIRIEASGDVEEDTRRLTAAHTRALERMVRAAPDQYFWFHKRWKTRPPGDQPGHGGAKPNR